jgi:hypothetical protein
MHLLRIELRVGDPLLMMGEGLHVGASLPIGLFLQEVGTAPLALLHLHYLCEVVELGNMLWDLCLFQRETRLLL